MRVLISVCALLLSISFTAQAADSKREIQIMSYNVENLFDTVKEPGKNDWTFLPKDFKGKKAECNKINSRGYRKDCLAIDWTPKALEMKLKQIKRVIDANPEGEPEVLALIEVENPTVVGKLAKVLGYKHFVMTDSPDKRGIDVALLYKESKKKLKFLNFKEHVVPANKNYPTRNILEVNFTIRGKHPLTVFVNHWPSQGGPAIARVKAAKVLKGRIDQILKKNPKHNVVAVGDFNTIPADNPHPFHTVLFEGDKMVSVDWKYRRTRDIHYSVKNLEPPGTYFYKYGQRWNVLDQIFVSKNMTEGKRKVKWILESYNILTPEFATKTQKYDDRYYTNGSQIKGVPLRYDYTAKKKSKAGFSDHFPISINLKF